MRTYEDAWQRVGYDVLCLYGFEKTAGSLLRSGALGAAVGGALGAAGGYATGQEGQRGENALRWGLGGATAGGALGVGASLLGRLRRATAGVSAPTSDTVDAYQESFRNLRQSNPSAERAARQARLAPAEVEEIQRGGLGVLTDLHKQTSGIDPDQFTNADDYIAAVLRAQKGPSHEDLLDHDRVWTF